MRRVLLFAVQATVLLLLARRVLPIPPVPPAGGPPDTAAPMPDLLIQSPSQVQATGPTLSPDFFAMHYYDQSKGYVPGSRMDARPERRPLLAPGLNLNVPLQ